MISSEYIHLLVFFLLFVFFLNPLINVRADQLLVVQNSVNSVSSQSRGQHLVQQNGKQPERTCRQHIEVDWIQTQGLSAQGSHANQ